MIWNFASRYASVAVVAAEAAAMLAESSQGNLAFLDCGDTIPMDMFGRLDFYFPAWKLVSVNVFRMSELC